MTDFPAYLAGLPSSDYLETHRQRYLATWDRAAAVLRQARRVLELGSLSPIGAYLRDVLGASVATVETDLRYPWRLEDRSVDTILCLEVLEHVNDAHTATSPIGEIAMFTASGARRLFWESARLLVPAGRMVLTTPNGCALNAIGNLLRRRSAFLYRPHVREYTPAEVQSLAEEVGFQLVLGESFAAWNPMPDLDRASLAAGLAALGYDMADREDDYFFLFTRPRG